MGVVPIMLVSLGVVHKRRRQLGQKLVKIAGGYGGQKFRKVANVIYGWSLTQRTQPWVLTFSHPVFNF